MATKSIQMTLYFTSDLHIGHHNIIKYCNRPYASVEEMNEALVNNWNSVVTDNDHVWILGDLCMGKIEDSLKIAARLNGWKTLLPGNHDRVWAGNGEKAAKWYPAYEDAGFIIVDVDQTVETNSYSIYLGYDTDQQVEVDLSHFPYISDSRHDDRFNDWLPIDMGRWLLQGHIHTMWKVKDRMINVGVDVWDYTPVAEKELLNIIHAGS